MGASIKLIKNSNMLHKNFLNYVMILHCIVAKQLQHPDAPPKHIKQRKSVPKECCYIPLTNMPTTPPPAAQVCVHVCVCSMYFKWSLPRSLDMRSLWSFNDTKTCARWGWALNLCQHPVWIRGSFNNGGTLFMWVFAQKGLDATKTFLDWVPISSSVPLWVSRN